MKKLTALFIIMFMLLTAIPAAFASASVMTNKTSALPGETILISGTANADESVMIKITDESGNIVFFDAAKADGSGNYAVAFTVPSDMEAGNLTVTAGSGTDVATAPITIASPPATATPAPTAIASAAPTATITASAAPTATVIPSTAHSATVTASATPPAAVALSPSPPNEDAPATIDAAEPEPTQIVGGRQILIPKEIAQDEKTGVTTIVIEIADLPKGTVTIETPTGDTLYVSGAKDGVLVMEAAEDDMNINGDIEITALSGEKIPLATLLIDVPGENAQTAEGNGGGWIIAICIAAGLVIVGAVLWIWVHWKNKQK